MLKKQKENTYSLWDNLWAGNEEVTEEDVYMLVKEEKGPVWRSIEQIILSHFDDFKDLKTIEIGGGMGTYSALMAKKGAEVTILDYSQESLKKSKKFFDALGLKANYICQDALALADTLIGTFDVSMSFGVTEHFKGEKRFIINKGHFDVLAKGGMTFIGAPNSCCFPYRFWKKKREILGKWHFGEEYPYTRRELKTLCQKIGIQDYFFIGTPFTTSFNFILPFARWKRSLEKRLFPNSWLDIDNIKVPRKTFLDAYLGWLLILVAEKK